MRRLDSSCVGYGKSDGQVLQESWYVRVLSSVVAGEQK